MVPYLQLERTTSGILANGHTKVLFDASPVSIKNIDDSGNTVFSYNSNTGEIIFMRAGVYNLSWFVAPQTSHSLDGINFAVEISDPIRISSGNPPILITASNHLKVSQLSGFAVIEITNPNTVVSLVNTSASPVTLSNFIQVTAGLSLFSITDSISSPTPPILGYLHAQGNASSGAIILDDEDFVAFSTLLSNDAEGIITATSSQTFTLEVSGVYVVQYEIPCHSTAESHNVTFSLLVDGTPYSHALLPLPIGVLVGTAIITTTSDGVVLSIQNTTGDTVMIDTNVNLVITQVR